MFVLQKSILQIGFQLKRIAEQVGKRKQAKCDRGVKRTEWLSLWILIVGN